MGDARTSGASYDGRTFFRRGRTARGRGRGDARARAHVHGVEENTSERSDASIDLVPKHGDVVEARPSARRARGRWTRARATAGLRARSPATDVESRRRSSDDARAQTRARPSEHGIFQRSLARDAQWAPNTPPRPRRRPRPSARWVERRWRRRRARRARASSDEGTRAWTMRTSWTRRRTRSNAYDGLARARARWTMDFFDPHRARGEGGRRR